MDKREKNKKEIGFYRARLSDTDVLYKVIDQEAFPSAIMEIIYRLKLPEMYVFISATDDAIVAYDPVFGSVPWCNCHTWTLPSCRGKKLKEFFWKTGIWMCHNTEYTTFTSVLPDLYRRQGLFLSAIGAKRRFEIDTDVFYTFHEEMFMEARDKLGVTNDILKLYER